MSEEVKVRYLKKAGAPDYDYHVYTERLAARGDMLPYDPTPYLLGQKQAAGVFDESQDESNGNDPTPVDPNIEALIMNAIARLDPETDFTKERSNRPSMPKVDALIAVLGFDISKADRDSAWAEYQKEKAI